MGRVTGIFAGPDGEPLSDLRVFFRRLSPASANAAGEFLPVNGTLAITTNEAGEIHDGPEEVGVALAAGRWLVTWASGATPSRLIVDVPDDSATRVLTDLVVGSEGRYGTIYWGRSEAETLTGDQVEDLEQSRGRASVAGTYDFGPGSGYLYLAWPDSMTPPVPGTGIWDTATDLPASMAGADEGYDEVQDGWAYCLVNVLGRAYRIYRSRQAVTDSITLKIT